jgi:hypothetical protein
MTRFWAIAKPPVLQSPQCTRPPGLSKAQSGRLLATLTLSGIHVPNTFVTFSRPHFLGSNPKPFFSPLEGGLCCLIILSLLSRAYFKGYLWTPESIASACHTLPLYVLQVASPKTALQTFQGWPSAGWEAYGRHTTLSYPDYCRMELSVSASENGRVTKIYDSWMDISCLAHKLDKGWLSPRQLQTLKSQTFVVYKQIMF